MTLDALIMLFGAFVALLPFLGFPNDWDTVLLLVAGIVIVLLGILVRRRMGRKSVDINPPHALVENSALDLTKHEAQQ